MIKERTVFVLGAGASEPYNLPTGPTLTKRVFETIDHIFKDHHQQALLRRVGFKNFDLLEKMGKSLKKAGYISIDRWLELNPSYKEIGRILIAKEINKYEGSTVDIERHWYADLWTNYLSSQCKSAGELLNNTAYFITFNYDRSLEHSLFDMACATFQEEKEEEIAKIINRIPIIHVHGRVGRLPWQTDDMSAYVKNYEVLHEWEAAMQSALNIKIMSDHGDMTREYVLARDWLVKAKEIYFLGFGYHNENLKRLRPNSEDRLQAVYISGSAFKLDNRDRLRLRNADNPFGYSISLGDSDHDVLEYLKASIPRF